MCAGDFTAEAARLKKPIFDPRTGQPFPGNMIPADRIDPNAALLLKTYFPLTNNPAGGFNNYINLGVGKTDPRTDTVRVDHNVTDNLRAAFTLSHDGISVENPNVPLFNASPFPVIRQGEHTVGLTGNVNVAMVLTPRTTNEAQYSFKRLDINLLLIDTAQATQMRPQGLNIHDYFQGANTLNLLPNISFPQGFGGIGTSQLPLKPATDDTHLVSDNLSHVWSKHNLQAGGLLFHYNKTQAIFNQTQGSYSFTGIYTNDPIADFLLGMAQTYSESQSRFIRSYYFNQSEWYVQDWRVSKRLTLNLGMRLFIMPLTKVSGKNEFISAVTLRSRESPAGHLANVLVPGANYDPLNGIVFPGQNGVPKGFADTYVGWAPRFGFAFDPTGSGKTAIRGGYGISYLNSGTNQSLLVLNPPFNVVVNLQNALLAEPCNGTPSALHPVSLNAFNPAFKHPMVHSWSLTVQRELPGELVAMVGYVGTRGTNWEVWIDRNYPTFAGHPVGLDFNSILNTSPASLTPCVHTRATRISRSSTPASTPPIIRCKRCCSAASRMGLLSRPFTPSPKRSVKARRGATYAFKTP